MFFSFARTEFHFITFRPKFIQVIVTKKIIPHFAIFLRRKTLNTSSTKNLGFHLKSYQKKDEKGKKKQFQGEARLLMEGDDCSVYKCLW